MEELKKEVDSIRLLHDAGLSNPSPFERKAIAVGNTLKGWGSVCARKLYRSTSGLPDRQR
jgi:hypothetical protein